MSLMERSHCYFLPSFNIGHALIFKYFFFITDILEMYYLKGKGENEKQLI